jgi:hypothetical protein
VTPESTSAGARPEGPDAGLSFAAWGDTTRLALPPLEYVPLPVAGPSRRRLTAVVALAVVVVVVGVVPVLLLRGRTSATPANAQTLNASGFTTSYPAGWTMLVKRADGVTEYQLSSTGAAANAYGIPPAGTTAITIGEAPAAIVATHSLIGGAPDLAAATQSALQLLPNVVGTPAAAQTAVVTTAAHTTTLGGIDAAATTYSYTYLGQPVVQSDVVARRGNEIVNAEMDADPSLASQGDAALATVLAGWRWN